jgi:hypothetical protein
MGVIRFRAQLQQRGPAAAVVLDETHLPQNRRRAEGQLRPGMSAGLGTSLSRWAAAGRHEAGISPLPVAAGDQAEVPSAH